MHPLTTITLLTAFVYAVFVAPRAIESVVRLFQEDRITEDLRARLEAKFGDNSLLTYGFRCFRCLAHWVGALWAILVGTALFAIGLPWQVILLMIVLVPASISLAEAIHDKD